MGQLAEAVADAELALSLEPGNKEIQAQLKGLKTDLHDANTAKLLQQQLQQPASMVEPLAAARDTCSPQELTQPENKTQSADSEYLSPSYTSASSSSSSKLSAHAGCATSITSAVAASGNVSDAAVVPSSSLDPRLVAANALLQVKTSLNSSAADVGRCSLTLFLRPFLTAATSSPACSLHNQSCCQCPSLGSCR